VSHIRQQRPTPRRHALKAALKPGRNMKKKIRNLHPVKAAGSNVKSHIPHAPIFFFQWLSQEKTKQPTRCFEKWNAH